MDDLREIIARCGSIRAAERELREQGIQISERTIRRKLKNFTVDRVPPREMSAEELIADRSRRFSQIKDHTRASQIRNIYLKTDEPIGIGFFGDPHVDDDGTDIAKLFSHAALFDGSEPGLYGACLGDIFNNWIGRLENLWAQQATTAAEAIILSEHFLQTVHWLFVVWGNHDLWNDKVPLLERLLSSPDIISAKHEQRVRLVFPNKREVLIHARHKFPGSSQYMKQFGQVKAAYTGNADIYIGGDKHVAGYSYGWNENQQKAWHAVQVASYKEIDDYPVELGLAPANLFHCPVAIVDPKAMNSVNFIRWEFDPFEGAKRLKWERTRR